MVVTMSYATRFSDEQIVQALAEVKDEGVGRDQAGDRVRPPNLCAFYNNLPRPERDRLLELAYGPAGRSGSAGPRAG